MKILQSKNICKSFNKRKVVDNVSINVQQGEIIGLLGPNGAGKTTTFSMMLGLLKPDEGEIFLDKEDITKLPVYLRARKGISFLPQEPSIYHGLSVIGNIQAVIEMQKKFVDSDINAESVLEEMGLMHIKDRKSALLSGGERRRLEIARALVLKPDFLLLDEPFAGIDPIQISEIRTLITGFKERGMGVIITDHNVRELLSITDRSYIISRGKVIFKGNSYDLIEDKKVKEEYLGKEFRWN